MKIGIIGAGNIGGALTRRFTALGHQVSVANSRGPESLAPLAKETGAKPSPSRKRSARRRRRRRHHPRIEDPRPAEGSVRRRAGDVVVIDTGNYYPQPARRPHRGHRERSHREPVGRAAARPPRHQNVQQHLRRNTCRSAGFRKAAPGRIALPVAGDDQRAKNIVLQLVDDSASIPLTPAVSPSLAPAARLPRLRERLRR